MYKRADIYVCALGRKGMGICMDFNQEKEQLKVPKELPEENDIRRSSSKKGIVRRAHGNKSWLYQGIAMSLVFAMLFSCFYGVFRYRKSVILAEFVDIVIYYLMACNGRWSFVYGVVILKIFVIVGNIVQIGIFFEYGSVIYGVL